MLKSLVVFAKRTAVWLLFLWVIWSRNTSVVSFSPTPPPRFDVFDERITGTWRIFDSSTEAEATEGEVLSVMRRCGGAVQGVREVPVPLGSEDEGMYLNRANDGFIYLDCGSYSFGPTKFAMDEPLYHNFSFERSRVLLTSDGSGDTLLHAYHLRKPTGEGRDIPVKIVSKQDMEGMDIANRVVTICAMSSSSQPWVRDRASWQSLSDDAEVKGANTGPSKDGGDDSSEEFICMACKETTQEFYELLKIRGGLEGGTVSRVALAHRPSGQWRSFARVYDLSDQLCAVYYMKGTVT